MSVGRKMGRVQEVLSSLGSDLKDLQSQAAKSYVESEDFEELLEETLRRVSQERSSYKRSIYKAFLSDAIQSPGEPHDEQLRFIRLLEDLQPDHFRVLKALAQEPNVPKGLLTGSPVHTLTRRIGDMTPDRVNELIADLNEHRISNLISLKAMMTALGAEDLRSAIADLGRRFLRCVVDA